MFIFIAFLALLLTGIALRRANRDYYLLAGCKRIKTVDGSKLETKLVSLPGKTIFGNNLDLLKATPEDSFYYVQDKVKQSKGKSFLMHFIIAPIYNITTAEEAEEVLQSQALITKSFLYTLIRPFLGLGLLISTGLFRFSARMTIQIPDEQWQFRRKILTPAFHFNILQTFIEVFKEESHKFIKVLDAQVGQIITLGNIVPQFTLNNVCETALGVKLDDIPNSHLYRKAIHAMEPLFIKRLCNPFMYSDLVFRLFGDYKEQKRLIRITHDFSSMIIEKKRQEFQKQRHLKNVEKVDEFGKKQRYAMLDTLLDAETQGLIDHRGICDEVNTFMFEGYDTTSICLMFTLTNLAIHQDIQQKCYEEIQDLASIDSLTVFDLNKLEYLECVIKENLRLYPSVPFIARNVVKETTINGLILPKYTQIDIHPFYIMRDERHFPEPEKFDPERFRPENTTNRHPFAFIPFSAGPRNCIGQKFAMLEVKMLLVAVLKNFKLLPITRLEDLTFQNGLVLRCKEKLQIKIVKRG